MNSKVVSLVKNLSYTLSSNFITLLISTLVVVVIPKVIGVEEYGYWQLYLFYTSYVGFLHFGWNDGVYLRYGGKEYKELDKKLFFSQFWMLFASQLIIAGGIFSASKEILGYTEKGFIVEMTAFCLLIVNARYMLLYILQGTNRIKEYAQSTMLDRIIYCGLIIALIVFGIRQYNLMILADLVGKLISLSFTVYCCKDIVFREISTFYFSFAETIKNISVGIKLMFANIANKLILGIVKFGIERIWDVSTFGKVSLTLSVSALMMTFISAVSLVMFPILRRTNVNNLSSIYTTMRTLLMMLLLGILAIYYPLNVILSVWLPQYAESLKFMALVFPMCVYEGKMSLLINTYLKTLRKEKLILFINVSSVGLSLFMTFIFVVLLKDLTLSVASILIILAFRCTLAEMLLSRILNISLYRDVLLEAVMTIIFILTGWLIDSWLGVVIYLFAYALYLLIKRKDILVAFNNLKKLANG